MLNKSKSKSSSLAELHFIASIQLEDAVVLVGDIADKQHQITLTEVSPSEYKFEIDYVPNETKQAQISGTLQRWNGTETKIDANGAVNRVAIGNTPTSRLRNAASIVIASFIVGGVVASISSGIFVSPILLGGMLLGYNAIQTDDESKKDETIVHFRARDYLLQKLIDVFKSVGDVEAI